MSRLVACTGLHRTRQSDSKKLNYKTKQLDILTERGNWSLGDTSSMIWTSPDRMLFADQLSVSVSHWWVTASCRLYTYTSRSRLHAFCVECATSRSAVESQINRCEGLEQSAAVDNVVAPSLLRFRKALKTELFCSDIRSATITACTVTIAAGR